MLPESELRQALQHVDPRPVHGPWSRSLGYHLLQGPPPGASSPAPQPLWPEGAMLRGGRFTPAGSFPTIYVACDPYTALVEGQFVLQTPQGPSIPGNTQPAALVTVDGIITHTLDLTDPQIQA